MYLDRKLTCRNHVEKTGEKLKKKKHCPKMFGMKQMGQLKINAECYTPASTIRNRGSQIDSTPIFSSTHYEQPLQN